MEYTEKSEFRCVERISDCWKQEKTEQGVKFTFPVPEQARGFYPYGFVQKNDSAADLAGWYGFVMELAVERPYQNRILPIRLRADFADRESLPCEVKVPLGAQSHCQGLAEKEYSVISLEVPLKDFPLETVREDYWQFVTDIVVEVLSAPLRSALNDRPLDDQRPSSGRRISRPEDEDARAPQSKIGGISRRGQNASSMERNAAHLDDAVECPTADIEVLYLAACRNRCVSVEMPVRGKVGEAGESVVYEGIVHNCTPNPMAVQICQKYEGWEAMRAKLWVCSAEEEVPGRFNSLDLEQNLKRKQPGIRQNGNNAWKDEPEDDAEFVLPGYGRMRFQAEVTVPENLAPGGHEETILAVTARDGNKTDTVEVRFETLRALPHPYIYHNCEGWNAVMEKIRRYPCYESAYQEYISTADAWDVHAPLEGKDYCYYTQEETGIMSAAYAYALSGERKYAEKIALFFRYFTDEEMGYPARKKGCSQSYVQEGHFFQHLAIPYDIIADAGVLTEQEKIAVKKSFRIYMEILDGHIRSGQISNWLVSEIEGAFYCALAIQDIERAQRFVFGNGGLVEQFRHGIFSDGWWHECSVGYNTWVSSMMIHMARAFLPFGYNLLHTQFPIPCNQEVSASYPGRQEVIRSGMYNQKWGGNSKNSVCIKDMFDAVVPFLDYRGVLFGIADSDEKKLTGMHFGSVYDLAYYYYRDERYIPVIMQCKPDPVFGNPEIDVLRSRNDSTVKDERAETLRLSDTNGEEKDQVQSCEYPSQRNMFRSDKSGASVLCEQPYVSAHSDNIGIAMLRSQTPDREKREQIQAVLRYGSHGGAHGHFDIASLLSVMRYGRSFFNPEHCWWGYAHFMYKFYVQCSLTKNMVVVDDKMQIPADSRLILFQTAEDERKDISDQEKRKTAVSSGKARGAWARSSNEMSAAISEQESDSVSESIEGRPIEAAGVEVRTRWAYPPYGGMVYYQDGQKNSRQDLAERCKRNHCYLPICEEEEPVYGEMSEYTEEICQRRVMAVADDYIVLFDYLEGEREHVYDSLMQLKGFRGITAAPSVTFMEDNDFYCRPTDCAAIEDGASRSCGENDKTALRWMAHTEQMDANPVSDAQFITDCNWYQANEPTVAHSEMIFTEEMSGEQHTCDRSNYNEPGILKMDVHTAWPHETEQMVGRVAVYDGWAAGSDGYTVPIEYRVTADGETLSEGAFDGWILGRGEIHEKNASHLDDTAELTFMVKQGNSLDEVKREVITPQCIFWGEIVLTLDDGTRFDVGAWMRENAGELPECNGIYMENTDFGFGIGKDYKNGRVTIVGTEYTNAIPASTIDHGKEGHLILRLKNLLPEGRHAVALDACVGVDAFAGDEDQKRKTYAVRTRGKKARFVTVIEPYEEEPMVREVCADTPDAVTVTLRDGTRQTVTVTGMESGKPKVLYKK